MSNKIDQFTYKQKDDLIILLSYQCLSDLVLFVDETMVYIFYNYRVPWSQNHPASRRWILTPTP